MEISYLDKQEGYEMCPQRTGRQGRGLERAAAIRSTPLDRSMRSIELAAPLLLPQSVWLLGLGGAWLARTAVWVPVALWVVLVRCLIVLKSRVLEF
ncbi:unnamed protein product [Microthlaspi erraticum]|uniref:Uncharacterized protein n=1 Tax=Microthlaspi erraticum TaxID=1685480 RepID=A0A6D2K2P1_9BRAS|nr:unnamed protein product [Microthlaspi erraticum]